MIEFFYWILSSTYSLAFLWVFLFYIVFFFFSDFERFLRSVRDHYTHY